MARYRSYAGDKRGLIRANAKKMTANPSFGKFALFGEEIISASGMFFNEPRPISGPSEAAVFSLIIVHPASVYVPFSAHLSCSCPVIVRRETWGFVRAAPSPG